jgi:thioredoxin-dependent peroxiredoxin
MKKLTAQFLSAVFISAAITLTAAEPLKVGDHSPDFTLKTLDGRQIMLSSVNASNEVVLIVLRGWPGYQCPLCERQVHDFVASAANFAEAKARVVLVYPGPADDLQAHAKEFLGNADWPQEFIFLTDPDYTMVNAYGLRWNAPKETAYPSTFIINREGNVRFAKISRSHGDRTKAADVLKALKPVPVK